MKKKLAKSKKKKGWALKEKIIASVSIFAITVSWTTIAMAAAISLNPQNFSDSSGADLYGRPPGGKCGPNNGKTVFVDKILFFEPYHNVDFNGTLDLIKPCAEGTRENLGGGSYKPLNENDGCMTSLYKCGSINCWVKICSSSLKGINGFANRVCGNGILDADLGEECDNNMNNKMIGWGGGPRDFGLPSSFGDEWGNNNPDYNHMFGHSCADKGFCGTAICTDKCKVDYSGCYPCPYMPTGFEQAPTTTTTSTLHMDYATTTASTTKP
jgi:hypothetical protein